MVSPTLVLWPTATGDKADAVPSSTTNATLIYPKCIEFTLSSIARVQNKSRNSSNCSSSRTFWHIWSRTIITKSPNHRVTISNLVNYMLVVLDPYKGFCFVKEKATVNPVVHTNGFDQLDWEKHLPEGGNVDKNDSEEIAEENAPKTKISRAERKQIKKQVAAKRKLRLSAADSDAMVLKNEPNPYLAKQRLKKLHGMLASGADTKLFDFGLIAFYKSDVDYVVPGEWLNDNNISFVYEALSTYFLKPHTFGHQVYMLYPALVQLFLHYPIVEEISGILPMKDLKKLKFVFIPFNFIDECDLVDLEDANNGDHWALCLLSVEERKLYVYDSMSFDDDEEDDQLLHQLASRLKTALFKPKDTISIVKMKCGQQTNFDDCGVYLVMFSCYLVSLLMSEEPTNLDLTRVVFNPLSGRLSMMELVYKLSKEQLLTPS